MPHQASSASLFGGFPSDVFFPGFEEDEGFAAPPRTRVPQIVAPQREDFRRSPLEKFLTLAAPVAQAFATAQLARRRRDRTSAFLRALAVGGVQTGIGELGRGRRIREILRQGQNQAQVQQFGLGEQAARTDIARERAGTSRESLRTLRAIQLANQQRLLESQRRSRQPKPERPVGGVQALDFGQGPVSGLVFPGGRFEAIERRTPVTGPQLVPEVPSVFGFNPDPSADVSRIETARPVQRPERPRRPTRGDKLDQERDDNFDTAIDALGRSGGDPELAKQILRRQLRGKIPARRLSILLDLIDEQSEKGQFQFSPGGIQ